MIHFPTILNGVPIENMIVKSLPNITKKKQLWPVIKIKDDVNNMVTTHLFQQSKGGSNETKFKDNLETRITKIQTNNMY